MNSLGHPTQKAPEGNLADAIHDTVKLVEGLGVDSYTKAKSAVADLDLKPLKVQIDEVMAAVSAGDFKRAEKLSESVDAMLESAIVSKAVGLWRVRFEEGSEAAILDVEDYLNLPNQRDPLIRPKSLSFRDLSYWRLRRAEGRGNPRHRDKAEGVSIRWSAEWDGKRRVHPRASPSNE